MGLSIQKTLLVQDQEIQQLMSPLLATGLCHLAAQELDFEVLLRTAVFKSSNQFMAYLFQKLADRTMPPTSPNPAMGAKPARRSPWIASWVPSGWNTTTTVMRASGWGHLSRATHQPTCRNGVKEISRSHRILYQSYTSSSRPGTQEHFCTFLLPSVFLCPAAPTKNSADFLLH